MSAILRVVMTALGGLLSAIFGFGLILTFTDETMRENWWAALIILIPSVWMLWKGICAGRELALARLYQRAFLTDENGSMTLDELIKQSGRSGAQVGHELERLFRKGYFRGCTLRKDPYAVLLTGSARTGELFASVLCPHCGGTTRLRAGSSGACAYCGSAIDAK